MKLDLSEDDVSLLVYLLGFAGGSADRDQHPGLLSQSIELANRIIDQKEAARRAAEVVEAQPRYYPKVVRPDLPRCSGTSVGTGPGRHKGDPCRAPATRPGGLCSGHFLQRHGHSVRYPLSERGGGYCKLCERRWDPQDRAVLQEWCPKKPPVPSGDEEKSWKGHDSWTARDACRNPGPNCAGKVKAVDYDGINECDFLLCAFHAKEYRNL